jgi:hypothetical protein
MKKALLIACGSIGLLASAVGAEAQGVYVGPGGIEFNRGGNNWDRRVERRVERRWDGDRTGTIVERREFGPRCRTVIVRRETDDGDIVTRRIRRC